MSHGSGSGVFRKVLLPPALYLVATPIGSARDITLRALDILASADMIASEDTRVTRHLMELHGIALGGRPILPYHDHNGAAQRPRLMAVLADGQSVAYASDAGTPMVADPGFSLVRAAAEAGHTVTAAPGPSAALAALTVAGLPSDRFMFAGFSPVAKGARRTFLKNLTKADATVIVFESPRRLHQTLRDMVDVFGEDRLVAVCRELTKKFEQVVRGTLGDLSARYADETVKGEVVLVIDRMPDVVADQATVEDALCRAMQTQSVKTAAAEVADVFNLSRRDMYQLALRLRDDAE
ncbi:16S rRNA (cytidine(1402)-2'-O)-methyltransferase [Actibacterium sp. 188UL27-1]|uniref:16S rRNA (cytidine(1402)-2'-O)-methyltransferase n=1 Tax=Actibacterium sp. 188UL27-1 TaxID=2786961 RepID=UPI00195C5388|nr:16S rRNA (cytidine(1402)-2'-O)-methyltransferase [Actibacterium sp. 188UL27-1]MBM7068125.1 16S rRNA (cytidine(1402)-2'-O)-methyltransferase [Actibacterium sp. 188UL27-1]